MSREQLPLDLASEAPRRRRVGALRSFHARSHTPVAEAQAGEASAARQDRLVLEAFRFKAGERLTPSQVHGLLCDQAEGYGRAPLLTSVRRSITNLTARGLLVHYPADRRPGPFGKSESTWGLA